VLLAICKENDTPEFHVDAGGEKSRCNENQDGLDGVGRNTEIGGFMARFGALKKIDKSVYSRNVKQVTTHCGVANDFEQSSDDKRNEEVRLGPDHLVKMQSGDRDEGDGEDDCTSHAWIIAVQLEVAILSV
jgi:hypothetical protein